MAGRRFIGSGIRDLAERAQGWCKRGVAVWRQEVRFEGRVLPHLRHVACQAVEQVPALNSSDANGNGVPPEDTTMKGCRPATISVHGGERAGRPRVSDSLVTPIVQAGLPAASHHHHWAVRH